MMGKAGAGEKPGGKSKGENGSHSHSRRPLTDAEIERRGKAIEQARVKNRRASIVGLSVMTGLSPKQVWHTLSIIKKRARVKPERGGLCPDKDDDCGPCKDCIGECPFCCKPILRGQSYTKTWVAGREVKVHLACVK